MSIALGIALILALTAATGYFVAQEFAYVAVDRNALKDLAAQGDEPADGPSRSPRGCPSPCRPPSSASP